MDLDQLVAVNVMGWKEHLYHGMVGWLDGEKAMLRSSFHPSTNMNDAWLVVEKLKNEAEISVYASKNAYYTCEIDSDKHGVCVHAKIAPEVICKAALKFVRVRLEDE